MKKIYFFILILPLVFLSACSLNKNVKSDVDNKNVNQINLVTTTSQVTENIIPGVMDLKIGDKLENFIVSKISPLNNEHVLSGNNFSVYLVGTTTVTGNYDYNDMSDTPYLTPDTMNGLPVFLEKNIYEISFPKKYLPDTANRKGRATISLNGLVLQSPSEEYAQDGSDTIIKIEILK
ncbi:MAG: hypothetical protein WCK37_01470 [Candidatus Falkowbacteria bacterium]